MLPRGVAGVAQNCCSPDGARDSSQEHARKSPQILEERHYGGNLQAPDTKFDKTCPNLTSSRPTRANFGRVRPKLATDSGELWSNIGQFRPMFASYAPARICLSSFPSLLPRPVRRAAFWQAFSSIFRDARRKARQDSTLFNMSQRKGLVGIAATQKCDARRIVFLRLWRSKHLSTHCTES